MFIRNPLDLPNVNEMQYPELNMKFFMLTAFFIILVIPFKYLSLTINEISGAGTVASINLTRLLFVGWVNKQFTKNIHIYLIVITPLGSCIFNGMLGTLEGIPFIRK